MAKRTSKKLPTYLTKEEYEELLKHTKSHKHKVAFYLAFMSGLRVSEVIKLEVRDIDIDRRRILIREGKGAKDRVVPLPKGFLKKYLKEIPIKLSTRSLQYAFKRAAKKSGLLETKPTASFHSLRHGFATHFIEKGGRTEMLRPLMGHANLATTSIYTHVNPKLALEQYEEIF